MKRCFSLFCLLFVVGLLLLCGGCGRHSENSPEEPLKSKNTSEQERTAILIAWETYWSNGTALEETYLLQDVLQGVVHFAAYFDAQNELMIPDETTRIYRELKAENPGMKHYLSIVNDKINADGSSSLKDTKVLYDLLSQEEVMSRHIDSILMLAERGGFDGIEIDYEAIKKDKKLWEMYTDFCEKLYIRLTEKHLSMRIILEPSAPLDQLDLPKGPEYVMMCYNLHSGGSTPGPKADKDFISSLINSMESVPGKKSFALATGGFDWMEGEKTEALTEIQAAALCEEYSVEPMRDPDSGALTFQYEDQNGKSHEVWYADGETLVMWLKLIKDAGDYGASLWRLDGNSEESLRKINDLLVY